MGGLFGIDCGFHSFGTGPGWRRGMIHWWNEIIMVGICLMGLNCMIMQEYADSTHPSGSAYHILKWIS